MDTLEIIHRIAFFYAGYILGCYVTRTGKSDKQAFIFQLLVYTLLIVLYFIAKAIVEAYT